MTVTDVQAAKNFLETYFGMRNPEGETGNKNFVILFDDNGLVLSLMKAPRGGKLEYPSTFHIGFGQESEAKVNEIYERLKADGFDAPAPERHHAWTFYILAPGGFTVEVMA